MFPWSSIGLPRENEWGAFYHGNQIKKQNEKMETET
jgi:hypothetical protein